MGSHSPPKDSFDSADIENIEEAFKAICATLVAHNPAGAAGLHDSLKLQIRRTLFALVRVSGETNPEHLRSHVLERLQLNGAGRGGC
jgi:hypothetical protein